MRQIAYKKKSLSDLEPKDAVDIGDSSYVVLKVLKGGMGRVIILRKTSAYSFKANDLGGNIVLKAPLTSMSSENAVDLFKRELTVWAGFSHRCIAPLIDIIDSPECGWIAVMRRHEGSLRDLMKRTEIFSLKEAMIVAESALLGLEYAFNKDGVVHLDIKPENILFDKRLSTPADKPNEEKMRPYEYRVSDWGIASIKQEKLIQANNSTAAIATAFDTLNGMGTTLYMAPERFEGAASSIASDIYSLGMMLIEMLTGKMPLETDCDKSYQIYQIKKEMYYNRAKEQLKASGLHPKMHQAILSMIHPDLHKRPASYKALEASLLKGYRQSTSIFSKLF